MPRNKIVTAPELPVIHPQKVIVGHREHLDNKLNDDGKKGDFNYLQAIGYAIIAHPQKGILAYRRAGSESRLNGQISIGFGGHTSVSDIVCFPGTEEIDLVSSTIKGMERELSEEVS